MQKTDELKKLAETDQTIAKFSIHFEFGFEFLKPKIFDLTFEGRFECIEPIKTKPNHNNIFYIKYIIYNIWASSLLYIFGPVIHIYSLFIKIKLKIKK